MKEPAQIIGLFMLIVLGASLLLLSAVAEHGETEMSKTLVQSMNDVPEMIEALLASAAAVTALRSPKVAAKKSPPGRSTRRTSASALGRSGTW